MNCCHFNVFVKKYRRLLESPAMLATRAVLINGYTMVPKRSVRDGNAHPEPHIWRHFDGADRGTTAIGLICIACWLSGCVKGPDKSEPGAGTEVTQRETWDSRQNGRHREQPSRSAEPNRREQSADTGVEPAGLRTHTLRRLRMVDEQLRGRDITDAGVLDAMSRVPRHLFVPESLSELAYADRPLPIGQQQTISQPYIVALMTQLSGVQAGEKALDVGTGSGYQAAVLAELVEHVYSIEIVEPLADEARQRLARLGYQNIEVRHGDGYRGWPQHAPFDVIIVAAAADHVPQPLIEQLAPRGRLVMPVGKFFQSLIVIEKQADGTLRRESVAPVAFVPMTGEAQR